MGCFIKQHYITYMSNKKLNHLINLVNQLERHIYEPLYDEKYVSEGHWDYVTYSFQDFLIHLEESHKILGRKKGLKFIDVGCGLGAKVHLAKLYFDSFGIELNTDYHAIASAVNTPREFLKYGRYKTSQGKKRIFNEDALKFDYKPYNVVYFFQPLCQARLQKQLEHRIFATIKPGTIVIPIYSQSTFPEYMRHLSTPSGEIYMKIMKDEKAQKMTEKVKTLF